MGKGHHSPSDGHDPHRKSSRDKHKHHKHKHDAPVAKPHTAPTNGAPVVASLVQPPPPPKSAWPTGSAYDRKGRRRKSFRFSGITSAVTTLTFLLLAVGCMVGGWYAMRVMFGNDRNNVARNTKDNGKQVAQANTGKSETPAPPTTAKTEPKEEPIEIKVKVQPKTEPKDDPKTEMKPDPKPETKPEPKPKPPEPKPEPEVKKPADDVPAVFYDTQVKAIFQKRCGKCHMDKARPDGKFDMKTLDAIVKGTKAGPGVIPGNLKKGILWESIADGSMPPQPEPKMTDAEKKLVADWIQGGARATAAAAADAGPAPKGGAVLAFEKDIAPILKAKCGSCHGATKQQNGLNLTTLALATKGGTGGPGIVPGKLDDGTIWGLISKNEMPPDTSPQLSQAEKDTIRRWIEMGAKDNRAAMVALRD